MSGCSNSKIGKVCFEDNCFNVELVISSDEKIKGLMYRDFLDLDSGMLFVFDKENFYTIWMKNTLIPLDVVWIDSNGIVVFIERDLKPCEDCIVFKPDKKAKYILEINSGIVDKIGLGVGERVGIYY